MAKRDSTKKTFVNDRDDNVFIGIDLPFRKSNATEGWFASTTDTISAVKNNIRLLLDTEKGERLMQPNLGMNLKKYMFEQYTDSTRMAIEDDIVSTFKKWLPFVGIQDIRTRMEAGDNVTVNNTMKISIDFNIVKDPTTLESITVTIK